MSKDTDKLVITDRGAYVKTAQYPETISREDEVKTKAETILKQIGVAIIGAVGARWFDYSDGYAVKEQERKNGRGVDEPYDVQVRCKVLRRQKVLYITLENNDTYTVELIHVPSTRAKDKTLQVWRSVKDVYCDKLSDTVYNITHGLIR